MVYWWWWSALTLLALPFVRSGDRGGGGGGGEQVACPSLLAYLLSDLLTCPCQFALRTFVHCFVYTPGVLAECTYPTRYSQAPYSHTLTQCTRYTYSTCHRLLWAV